MSHEFTELEKDEQREKLRKVRKVKKFLARYDVVKNCYPLKLNIHKDMLEKRNTMKFGSRHLRRALYEHTQCNPTYLAALLVSEFRYDLKGRPCGKVTEEDREHASNRLQELLEMKKPLADKSEGA